ncbi:MAG: hypothetical protein KDK53_19745 [Maritimibacter sp.]|nr:hypothetical protein [Maritimibacter sp.]
MRRFLGSAGLLAVVFAASAVSAQALRGPELQAASNFGQTWNPVVFEAARAEGITALRDELHWDYAERGGSLCLRPRNPDLPRPSWPRRG